MKAIAAADQHWALGNKGELLVHIAEDLKYFQRQTTGKVVICGRKTLATFPGGKPLKNRANIILSRNPSFQAEGALIAHSTEELFAILKQEFAEVPEDDIFVIGGEQIYRTLLPWCSSALITRIEKTFAADAFFPDLDQDPNWVLETRGEDHADNDLIFHFDTYRRKG